MIKVNIVTVGSIKESFFTEAIKEYSKRLSRFCNLNVIEVKEASNESSIAKKIDKESDKLIEALSGTIVLLDRQGKLVSSEELANTIDNLSLMGDSEISFVVGGSNGVNDKLRNLAKHVISFGKITYPHQLFRVVLLEQIYRAFTIIGGLPYHK